MNQHSIIPPSSAGIWGKPNGCTAWPLMNQQFPELEDSEDSKDGTASHEIGKDLILDATVGNYSATFADYDGKCATNGTQFLEEMFDCAQIYADDVAAVMRDTHVFGGPNIGIEQHIDIFTIHELSHGTPDTWIYDQINNRLYIWDYKFGHDIVEIFECWQLLNYLSGILDKLEINGLTDQTLTVHLRIIQPRGFHRDGIIREWVVQASDLRAYFNIIAANAAESLGPNPVTRSGSHCKNCNARHACPSALQAGVQLYEVARQPMATELSPDALGVQLAIVRRAIKQMEYINEGMTAQAEGLLRKGQLVPGWSMQSGQGRETWSKPIPEIIALGDCLKQDLRKTDQAITPKQARAKGISDTIINEYSETKRTALSLTADNGNKAKRLFNHD